MDAFHKDILRVVQSIPRGHVVSYGQVAAYVGAPKASREVGWAMQRLGDSPDFPWWRVLNSAGKITLSENTTSTTGASGEQQQELLEKEGVVFKAPLILDIEKYRYRADKATLQSFQLSPDYIEEVFAKYDLPQAILAL